MKNEENNDFFEIKIFLNKNKEFVWTFLKIAEDTGNAKLHKYLKQEYLNLNATTFDFKISQNNLILPTIINKRLQNLTLKEALGKKYLFFGQPGTGKTYTANWIAKKFNLPIKKLRYSQIISKKLGDTLKNLEYEIFNNNEEEIIFFDEFDMLLTDRLGNDSDEMKRTTTNLFFILDKFPSNKILIMSTNLYKNIDQAILRRINYTFNFNDYNSDQYYQIFIKKLEKQSFINDEKLLKNIANNFFYKKFFNFIQSNIKTPSQIYQSLEETEAFYKIHNENNLFLLFVPFLPLEYNLDYLSNLLKTYKFSDKEIYFILKNNFDTISNQKIRIKIKELINANNRS